MRIFLLTKTPQSERTKLCLRLAASSQDAVVYLAGDGVYNLLRQDEAGKVNHNGEAVQATGHPCQKDGFQALAATLQKHRIFACLEDLEARGVHADGKATIPADFYGSLVNEMMREGSQVYSF